MSQGLPAHLASLALRLGRVDELVADIAHACFAFVRSNPVEMRERRRGDTAELFVHAVDPVPPIIGLAFSDAVNQMRSTLDNALVLLLEQERREPLTGRAERAAKFLIHEKEAEYYNTLKPMLRHLPELAPDQPLGLRMFEMQPFRPLERIRQMRVRSGNGDTHGGHHLRVLQAYSNADKHRRPHIFTVGNAALASTMGAASFHTAPLAELVEGQVISSTRDKKIDVIEFWPFVGVRRPDVGELVPPGAELDELHRYLGQVALPRLAGLPQGSFFPPQVDLRSLGRTEQERVATASPSYAHARLGLHFGLEVQRHERELAARGEIDIQLPRRHTE